MDNKDVVYSPEVTVFRHDEKNAYRFMEKGETLAFLANPAVADPHTARGVLTNPGEIALITNKIRTTFKVALLHQHESLVLGAWGCGGAFGNASCHISRLFREVIEEFYGCFHTIVFAIPKTCRSVDHEIFNTTFS